MESTSEGFFDSSDILDLSLNEEAFYNALKLFCEKNAKTFHFPSNRRDSRRHAIAAILLKLTPEEREERNQDYIVFSLEALKILSRDQSIVDELCTDSTYFLFMELAGLYVHHVEENADEVCTGEKVADILEFPKLLKQIRPVTEALKCLCNVFFNSVSFQKLCEKHDCSKYILQRLNFYANHDMPADIKAFDMRLLFLISALIPKEREKILTNNGLKLLVNALDLSIPLMKYRVQEMELYNGSEDADGLCASTITEALWKILQKVEKSSIDLDQTRISGEILKVLFNVTLCISKEGTETSDCCRLAVIIRYMLTYCTPLPQEPENLLTHAVNILNNLPMHSYSHLIWKMPDKFVTKVRHEERKHPKKSLSVEFERYNMTATNVIVNFMEERLSDGISLHERLSPVISALTNICRFSRVQRRYIRQVILPPLQNVGYTRPEEGTGIKNKLIKLMTNPQIEVKEIVSEFLFVLCKENKDRMIKHTGYGNAAGFLFTQGLLTKDREREIGDYSSDDDDSDTEEYLAVRNEIDPVLGAQHRDVPTALDSMTDEEKEEEAFKLVNLIEQLNSKGVIKPMFVNDEGETHEMTPQNLQDSIDKTVKK